MSNMQASQSTAYNAHQASPPSLLPQKGKDSPPSKELLLFSAWIFGLFLIAVLAWFFTQPVRSRALIEAVNHSLEQSGDARRLDELLLSGSIPSGVSRAGFWFTLREIGDSNPASSDFRQTQAFVFTLFYGGAFFPCAALLTREGQVAELIPLGAHGRRVFANVPGEVLRLYARRIEGRKP